MKSVEKSQLATCVWTLLADRWCSQPRYHDQGGEYEVGRPGVWGEEHTIYFFET